MRADLKHRDTDDSRHSRAKPSLPPWQRLGERIRQAALAATTLHLIEILKKMGAVPNRLEIKLVGGAHMTPASAPGIPVMRIGDRNITAVKAQLKKLGLKAKAENLGGNKGRTVRLDVESGRVTVVTAGTEKTNL